MSGYSRAARPAKKRVARRGGLVPTYRGFTPRQFSRGEWKYNDLNTAVDINSTATLTLLNGLQPGTAANQRVGMKITMKTLEIRARMATTAATGVEQFARWFIVLDRQPNGAAPGAITDIISAAGVQYPRNLANRKRFKILLDKCWAFGATSVATGTPTSRFVKYYLKFRRPLVTEFNTGVAGTVADISTNSLYLVVIGSEVAGNTDVQAAINTRLRYTDM